ncbi:hypothetical protein S58_35610 [Bradyrhizobium oligotrophicum S58]|uniref:Uncharacterized protein n=1 Tax=Bradyrhizobium oligotrophicum S58 TaxID=1245469 RepID=M4Z7L7_9BRAD|nr:hypothetical protein S58_35610 [Bradyrhizobium oligotrophicum S58]
MGPDWSCRLPTVIGFSAASAPERSTAGAAIKVEVAMAERCRKRRRERVIKVPMG